MRKSSTNRQDGPQEGVVARRGGSKPQEFRGGRAPVSSKAGQSSASTVGLHGIRAGTPPSGPKSGSKEVVAGGASPRQGPGPRDSSVTVNVRAAAPHGAVAVGGGTRSSSEKENQRAQYGRQGFRNGGKVNPHGADKKKSDGDAADGAYARGGKVKVPAGGGNGGLTGGNASIPLQQPGGQPSTGVQAGGTLPMTNTTMGTESTMATPAPKLRTTAIKRSGRMPSLPRPRR